MLQVKIFEFNPFQENTYVLYDETLECVIIDPGCSNREEESELVDFIAHNKLTVKLILNTHCHVDHVLGNWFAKTKFAVDLRIPEHEQVVLTAVRIYAPTYGFHTYQEATPDMYLKEGDIVRFGNQSLDVLFVPGHSPGHVAFYHPAQKLVIGGDVLFYNSIGRTDLPGGNFETLIDSIHKKLFTLPDEVIVYPGHGPETSVGFEKRTNPFCAVRQ
jgi:hydroxyacylglutathione hydrolase